MSGTYSSFSVYLSIVRLAGSILLMQLSIFATTVLDTIMAGRRSSVDLAAVGLGASVYIVFFVALLGVLLTLQPQFAKLVGAQSKERLREHSMQAFWAAIFLGTIGFVILWYSAPFIRLVGGTPEVAELAVDYLRGFAVALPAVLVFRVFYALSTALGAIRLVIAINIVLLIFKITLNHYFMDGRSLGAAGCGVAMAITAWASVACAAICFRYGRRYREIAFEFGRPQFKAIKNILLVGYPVSLMQVAEVASFAGMALFISEIGLSSLAAHQAAANFATTLFMIPLSLSLATSVVVSKAIGAKDIELEKSLISAGTRIAITFGVCAGLFVVIFGNFIAMIYTSDSNVLSLLRVLLLWVALSQLADFLQVYFICLLRSYDLTYVPFIINVLTRCVLGLGGGLFIAFGPLQMGVVGFWIGSSIGLLISAFSLWRYWIPFFKSRHLSI